MTAQLDSIGNWKWWRQVEGEGDTGIVNSAVVHICVCVFWLLFMFMLSFSCVQRHWDGRRTASVCRGCNCDVISCTWEGRNVGGLLSERERERDRLVGGAGGCEEWQSWSREWVEQKEPYKMLQYVRVRPWLHRSHNTTQQSGQTADKEVEMGYCIAYSSVNTTRSDWRVICEPEIWPRVASSKSCSQLQLMSVLQDVRVGWWVGRTFARG
jgi:hypothetical protein